MPKRVLVACYDANGIPTLYPAVVSATGEQVKSGEHYRSAERQAWEKDYELPDGTVVCIDKQDAKYSYLEDKFDEFFSPTNLA